MATVIIFMQNNIPFLLILVPVASCMANKLIVEDSFFVSSADECQQKCKESTFCKVWDKAIKTLYGFSNVIFFVQLNIGYSNNLVSMIAIGKMRQVKTKIWVENLTLKFTNSLKSTVEEIITVFHLQRCRPCMWPEELHPWRSVFLLWKPEWLEKRGPFHLETNH